MNLQSAAVTSLGAPVAVGLGEMAVAGAGTELVIVGLGSCVGLALWCPRLRIGALCHIVLPDSGGAPPDPAAPARFADQAVPWAVAALGRWGARAQELVAKLAGGAQVLPALAGREIGRENVAATLAALAAAGVPVAAADTGGRVGRTIRFRVDNGALEVRAVGSAPTAI